MNASKHGNSVVRHVSSNHTESFTPIQAIVTGHQPSAMTASTSQQHLPTRKPIKVSKKQSSDTEAQPVRSEESSLRSFAANRCDLGRPIFEFEHHYSERIQKSGTMPSLVFI